MLRTSTTHDDYARSVERLLEGGSAVGLTEAQLVERFAGRRDEAAFAALVDRHGPMVLGVCRRLLRDPNDADDAFQAVFLVLARKAGGLRRKELVANWLHGVARRVASEARRRPRPATSGDESAFDADARRPAPPEPSDAAARDEDGRRLHEEVGRLPERYRAPVVVCYFEGRTHEEAAALLNWPVGTVKGRLARARDLLRARLERRGVTAPAALLATALAAPDLRAAVPPALAARAVAAGLAVAASPSAWMTSAALSTTARTLSEGAIQAMFYAQVKAIAIPVTLAAGLLAAGAGLATAGRNGPQEPADTKAAPASVVAKGADAAPEPTPSPDQPPREEYATDQPLDALGPMEVLKLIDETGKDVLQYVKRAEVDLINATPIEAHEEIEHFCDEVNAHIERVRSARVADPAGRSLLDAFADDLATMLDIRNGRLSRSTALKDGEVLDDAFFVFTRSLAQSRRRIARSMDTPDEAKKRHALTLASVLQGLREPKQEGVSKPLLAAYAEYLEAIDPFAEAPAFRRASAEAPPSQPTATPERPAARSVSDALVEAWQIAEKCRKSYEAAIQSAYPVKAEEQAAAMSRHRDRVGQLGKTVRDRAAGDPLLLSLADYLDFRSKSPAKLPNGTAIPDMAIDMIARVPGNLEAQFASAGLGQMRTAGSQLLPTNPVDLLAGAWRTPGFDPSDFDRQLMLEKLVAIQHTVLEESLRQAEREPEAGDLLTRHAEYVRKFLAEAPPYPTFPKPAATDATPPEASADPAAAPPDGRLADAPAPAPASEPTAAQDRPAGRSVEDVLNVVWKVADQYQKSYQAAVQFDQPVENNKELAEAMARHLDRVQRLGKDVRDHAAGDPLLLSLADYLDLQSKPATAGPDQSVPTHTALVIGLIRTNLASLLDDVRLGLGPDPSAFDRELVRERLAKSRDRILAESLRLAERDEAARDLLTRHAEYVTKLLADDASLFPPPRPTAAPPVAAVDPATAPAAGQTAEAPSPATTIPDRDALGITWRIAEQYQKSLDTATRPAMGKPLDDPKAAEAMARHVQRIGRMAEDLRRRSAGDPLLVSLAEYLAADFQSALDKPNDRQAETHLGAIETLSLEIHRRTQLRRPETETDPGAIQTLSLILMARDNLEQVRGQERTSKGPDLDDFDRSLTRERVLQAMESTFDDLALRAEKDARSRDLLGRYSEVLKRYMRSDECLFPELTGRALPSARFPFPAPAPSPDPTPAPSDPAATVGASTPAPAPGGGFGGFSGPSPGEMRQKVAGLAATLAIVDDEPSNRKVHDALERPAALKTGEKATLGDVIEQVKKALKDEDGSPIPVYVDPKGLEDADASLDSPVSIDLEGVPLKFSLRLALKQLGLASCVRDGVLIISSLEGIEQELLEAQRELMSTHPGSFILQPDGTTLPAAGMGRPGGMM